MNSKILIVDDDRNLLDSMRRGLCRRYALSLAQCPEEALGMLDAREPFAVVLTDLRMPGMDGLAFLERVKARSPASVRMMLTGHGDLDAAMSAVNDGNVFRFLTKPCPLDTLVRALDAGVAQYRLLLAEKELLRGTLRGCIKVLVDVLNLVNPEAFSRGERVKRMMLGAAKRLGWPNTLKYDLAGMLSQIGIVAVPQEIVDKRFHGLALSPEEEQIYRMHATVAATLLSQIPRMNEVVSLIGCQADCFGDAPDGPEMPQDAVLLNLCLEFDDHVQAGVAREQAGDLLRAKWEARAPAVLKAFLETAFSDSGYFPGRVALKDLLPGMVLRQNIHDAQGMLIMARGQEISEIASIKLARLRASYKLPGEVDVLVPVEAAPAPAPAD